MPPYEDWNKIDEEEDEELQDASVSTQNTITSLSNLWLWPRFMK